MVGGSIAGGHADHLPEVTTTDVHGIEVTQAAHDRPRQLGERCSRRHAPQKLMDSASMGLAQVEEVRVEGEIVQLKDLSG
jgi:hypothetical protein